jgi:cation:H+ antiporter
MNVTTLLLLLVGLVLLVAGAEILVRGASRIAVLAGLSPLIIGLTIVAYGTSSPEMAVSIRSGLAGQADISLGNVVGSNVFNVLAILGISSIISPLPVARQLVRLDVPIMIGVAVLMFVFGLDGKISRIDGTILFIGGVIYTIFLIQQGRKEQRQQEALNDNTESPNSQGKSVQQVLINGGLIVVGLILLVLGANWFTDAAVSMARAFGVSELVIGLTLVAFGTSLPELASSTVASLKGERDIAVGNVVGSNIFNILAVLGLAAIFSPTGVNVSLAAIRFDIPFMMAVSFACLPIFFTGYQISRKEGMLFLAYYAAYTLYLILKSTEHAQLPIFSQVMLTFVIPLTVLTLVLSTLQALRARRKNLLK